MAIDFSTFFRHNIKEQGGKVPAARCRRRVRTPMPLRGACGCWHRQALVGRQSHYCIVKAESPFTRRTTSAGGKVPLPGARSTPFGVARAARCRRRVRTPMPLRGACGCWHRQALVGRQSHYCIVKAESPFTRRTISAVSAAAARCRCRVRALRPSGARGGWHWQAWVGQQSHLRSIIG